MPLSSVQNLNRDETRRTGAGTFDNPLTDIQIDDLLARGISEGDVVPGKGILTPAGTFRDGPVGRTQAGVAAPQIAPAADPTIGQSFSEGFQRGDFSSNQLPSFEDIYGREPDRRKVERDQMRLFQREIDATNRVYDELLNKARLEGQGRLGSQRAISARGGLLGSDFGAAQKSKIQEANLGVERGIGAERSAAIGAILGQVRSSVRDEIALKNQARQQGAENYLAYLSNSQERKNNLRDEIVGSFLAQGYDPTELDPNELAAISNESGISTGDIINSYRIQKSESDAAAQEGELKTRKTEAEIRKIDADIAKGKLVTLGEGTMLYDTETGQTFKNPKTYKPGGASGISLGGQQLTQDMIADVHDQLNQTRGSDGYANTDAYMQEFNAFVALGGDPKDFVKEYDPDIYINPRDETRSFLQSQMKKTPTEAAANDIEALIGSFETLSNR